MNQFIENIYETGSVVGRSGQIHELHSAIDRREGAFIHSIINNDSTIRHTLEVGCAYGLSSLHICSALRDRDGASHTIIDPFQNLSWDGIGIRNLETLGIDFFNLMEKKSEFALPQLLEKNEAQFDFIFIDGWHTFDHTLLDCFYATRLLRVGGVLAIDDVSFQSVRRVVSFLKNYPCYEEYGSVGPALLKKLRIYAATLVPSLYRKVVADHYTRMVALKKTMEDTRDWDWHSNAF
ncbi:class I SAM-dependent methyltransferase [Candidatus Hydrogenedentota bacterium]